MRTLRIFTSRKQKVLCLPHDTVVYFGTDSGFERVDIRRAPGRTRSLIEVDPLLVPLRNLILIKDERRYRERESKDR